MSWRGLRWTQTRLSHWAVNHCQYPESPTAAIATTTAMVKLAARYSRPWSNCLRRSLTLWAFLLCQGIETQLRIGTRRDRGQLESHAWLEYEGQVLGDRADIGQAYTAFATTIDYTLTSSVAAAAKQSRPSSRSPQ